MTIHIEQEARADAEAQWNLENDTPETFAIRTVKREAYAGGYIAGATRPEPPVTEEEVEAAGAILYESWDTFDFDDPADDWTRGIWELVRSALEAARATREGESRG